MGIAQGPNTGNLSLGAGAEVVITDGVQDLDVYAEGDTDASINGIAVMMEGAGNALVPLQGTAADGALVNLGANNDVTVTGTVTEASGAGILTAVQLIDDTVFVDDTATHSTGTTKGVGIMAVAVPTDTSVNANDIGMVGMTTDRRQYVEATIAATQTLSTVTTVGAVTAITNALPAGTNNIGDVDVLTVPRSMMGPAQPGTAVDSYTHASFNLAAGNDQVLVASAANKQIWVYGIGFTVNVAGTVSFQDEDNVAITGVMQMGATGGMVVAPSGNFSMPIWKLGTDKDLEVDVVTSELDGWVDYAIIAMT